MIKPKVLVFGASGMVGSYFIKNLSDFKIKAPSALDVDIVNPESIQREMKNFLPQVVVNLAAYTNVEEAENQKDDQNGICFKVNSLGPKNLALACQKFDTKFLHISTEYVFDGTKEEAPYQEDDKPNPINWYGMTKYLGEQFVVESGAENTIVRLSMPYTGYFTDKKDIARFFLDELKGNREIAAIDNQRITPTFISGIAAALKAVVEKMPGGIYHVCSSESTTPFEFAKLIARRFNLDESLIKPVSFEEYNRKKRAKLLKNSWLNPAKFIREFGGGILNTIEDDVGFFKQTVAQAP